MPMAKVNSIHFSQLVDHFLILIAKFDEVTINDEVVDHWFNIVHASK